MIINITGCQEAALKWVWCGGKCTQILKIYLKMFSALVVLFSFFFFCFHLVLKVFPCTNILLLCYCECRRTLCSSRFTPNTKVLLLLVFSCCETFVNTSNELNKYTLVRLKPLLFMVRYLTTYYNEEYNCLGGPGHWGPPTELMFILLVQHFGGI